MIEKLPINTPIYTNTNNINNSVFSIKQIDCYLEKIGNDFVLNKRPGLRKFASLGFDDKPIQGLYVWEENNNYLYVVCDGFLFEIQDDKADTIVNLGQVLESDTSNRPTFASDDKGNLFIANGGQIIKYNGSSAPSAIAEPAPQEVTHVAWVDGYVIANKSGTGRFYWSAVNDPDTWNALWFANAEANPDPLTAIKIVNNEIHLIGPRSIEIWYNAGDTGAVPFRRYQGAFVEHGCIAPYTALHVNSVLYFFDQHRNLIRMNGRTPEILSEPVALELNRLNQVFDAMLDYINVSGKEFILLTFPTEDKTFVYDLSQNIWQGNWCFWNENTAEYSRFLLNCYVYSKKWNYRLVGDRTSGTIYLLSSREYTDNNNVIRSLRQTGWIDWEKRNHKRTRQLTFKVSRGGDERAKNITQVPQIQLQYRDSGMPDFTPEIWANLGENDDYYFYLDIYNLGIYKSRQYQIIHSEKSSFNLAWVMEDFDILKR